VTFYFITAYTPTFGREVLKLSNIDSLIVTMCVGISNLFWLPVMGAASDRLGRKPLLILFTLLMIVSAYPALLWLVSAPSFARLLTVELWLSFIYASYNGAMVVALTEIVPLHVRTSGFAVAYSLATATFGGFTPAVVTYLIHATDNRAVAGLWLMFAAACGLVATLLAYRKIGVPQGCSRTTRRDECLGASTLTRQSRTDIPCTSTDVRFTSESGHRRLSSGCQCQEQTFRSRASRRAQSEVQSISHFGCRGSRSAYCAAKQ